MTDRVFAHLDRNDVRLDAIEAYLKPIHVPIRACQEGLLKHDAQFAEVNYDVRNLKINVEDLWSSHELMLAKLTRIENLIEQLAE